MSFLTRLRRAFLAFWNDERPISPHVFCRRQTPRHDLPLGSPMDSEIGRASRQEAALSLMDSDLYGFLLLEIIGDPQTGADIRVQGHVDHAYWPGVIAVMSDLALEVEEQSA